MSQLTKIQNLKEVILSESLSREDLLSLFADLLFESNNFPPIKIIRKLNYDRNSSTRHSLPRVKNRDRSRKLCLRF